jgi:hypothetical protein
MHQVLHDPKLAKLDLGSIESMGSGAAYMPPDLRVDFERRVKKAPMFIEGLFGFPVPSVARAYSSNLAGYGMSECVRSILQTACSPTAAK